MTVLNPRLMTELMTVLDSFAETGLKTGRSWTVLKVVKERVMLHLGILRSEGEVVTF